MKILILKSKLTNLIRLLIILIIFFGCTQPTDNENKAGEFEIQTKYSKIRSCNSGGGLFIVYLEPGYDFEGKVELTIIGEDSLNIDVNRNYLDKNNRVAEITIKPNFIEIEDAQIHEILIIAKNDITSKLLLLEVEMCIWDGAISPENLDRFNNMIDLVLKQNQKYEFFRNEDFYSYCTYPQILIVSHYTFLSENWEVRFCHHEMIPPHDWSMILIRKRGEIEAEISYKNDSSNNNYVNEIPISEYPILYGY
jgi:hypothetical protein